MANQTFFLSFIHLLACGLYVYCIYFCIAVLRIPRKDSSYEFAGQGKYLTHWNLWVQGFVFGLAFLVDISPCSDFKERFGRIRDFVFASIALPLALFVATIFWTLYAIDRELIFPVELDAVFPNWLNHLSHTTIVPFALLEIILQPHHIPGYFAGLLGNLTFMLVYLSWTLYLGMVKNVWVYPVYDALSTPMFAAFCGVCLVIIVLFYSVGYRICSKLNTLPTSSTRFVPHIVVALFCLMLYILCINIGR